MMLKSSGIATIFVLLFTAGCTGSASDSAAPTPEPKPSAKLVWSTACPAFGDALDEGFQAAMFDATPPEYREYVKALTQLVSDMAPSERKPIQRVIVASSTMGDLTEMYPNPNNPNDAEFTKARDEFADSIIAMKTKCKAHGHSIW